MIAVKQPMPINMKQPAANAAMFANSLAKPGVPMGTGKPLKNLRGGTKILVKNPFQGAINNEALGLRKY